MKILITGSTQGIGKALAQAFVERGDEVIVHGSHSMEKVERVRAEIGAAQAVVCDLSDLKETKELFKKTGEIDCLIINASVQYKTPWHEIKDEEMETQLTVNFKSTLKLMQAYYPAMKEKGFGRIVTIRSVQQYKPHKDMAVYAATKCAVVSMVENIAKQVAPFGITVNNVAPGVFVTPRNDVALADEEYRGKILAGIPVGYAAEPKDCVGAVLLLCSEAGKYITGADIVIDGGMRL